MSQASFCRIKLRSYKEISLSCPGKRKTIACIAYSKVPAERSLLQTIIQQYAEVQSPAKYNKPYTQAMTDFAKNTILAYECGYSEEMLSGEFSRTGPQSHIVQGVNEAECLACVSLVWITLLISPESSVRRWSTGAPVTDATLSMWRGFVAMIVFAYFEKRWAWYPIDRLQLELSAVAGRSETPSTVAEWARLVYCTLELVAPQFPK